MWFERSVDYLLHMKITNRLLARAAYSVAMSASTDALEPGFGHPHDQTQPPCYWISDNLSEHGTTNAGPDFDPVCSREQGRSRGRSAARSRLRWKRFRRQSVGQGHIWA